MKKLLFLFVSIMLLQGCSSEEEPTQQQQQEEEQQEQDEEAVEVINGGSIQAFEVVSFTSALITQEAYTGDLGGISIN
ncbi:MAG: hypothetical protein K0U54_12305, partial [Bacteroidetes bacterium]|nr:hypothetical protein [Bacteroidota bacterium]